MPGAERLTDSKELIALLREQQEAGRLYAAICAAPAVVLEHHKLLEGLPATSHPAFVEGLSDSQYAFPPWAVLLAQCVCARRAASCMLGAQQGRAVSASLLLS